MRKNFRGFRVYVIRGDEQRTRKLSLSETFSVWIRIFAAEYSLSLVIVPAVYWLGHSLSPEAVQQVRSVLLWCQFLLIGPFGIDLALRSKYTGFRLQAYAFGVSAAAVPIRSADAPSSEGPFLH